MNEKINIVVVGNDNQVAAGSGSIVQASFRKTSFLRCKGTMKETGSLVAAMAIGFLAGICCTIVALIYSN